MKVYTINKKFKNQEALENWEKTNCPERTYNGENILMVSSEGSTYDKSITLKSITTI